MVVVAVAVAAEVVAVVALLRPSERVRDVSINEEREASVMRVTTIVNLRPSLANSNKQRRNQTHAHTFVHIRTEMENAEGQLPA